MEVLQLMCGLFSGFVAAGDVRVKGTEKTFKSTCSSLLTLTSRAPFRHLEGRKRKVYGFFFFFLFF